VKTIFDVNYKFPFVAYMYCCSLPVLLRRI